MGPDPVSRWLLGGTRHAMSRPLRTEGIRASKGEQQGSLLTTLPPAFYHALRPFLHTDGIDFSGGRTDDHRPPAVWSALKYHGLHLPGTKPNCRDLTGLRVSLFIS